jgi:hypothetical protein
MHPNASARPTPPELPLQKAGGSETRSRLLFLLYCVAFVATADVGPYGPYDAVAVACVGVFARPAMAPFIAVMASFLLDARGLGSTASYPLLSVLLVFTMVTFVVKRDRRTPLDSRFKWILLMALCTVAYGFLVSYAYTTFGGPRQSSERPFALVGVLMIFMILGGVVISRIAAADPESSWRLSVTVALGLFNSILVCSLQALLGPGACHSPEGVLEIARFPQLSEAWDFGLPRLTGTTLSPNALALLMCLGTLILTALRRKDKLNWLIILGFFAVGAAAFIFSQSRSALSFFALSLLVLMIHHGGAISYLGASGLVLTLLGFIGYATKFDAYPDILRLGGAVFGNRGLAWEAQVDCFSASDWFFGRGLSNWKVFFEDEIGIPMQDPHSYLLSVPGSFGVVGVTYYVVLAIQLVRTSVAGRGLGRAALLMAGIVIFVANAFEVLILLGNTTLTLLLWIGLGLAWDRCTRSAAAAVHGRADVLPTAAPLATGSR